MISLFFDVLIAILLVVTIAFCILLSKRLKRLRADEDMMRDVVADIVQSTGKAEHAIRTLKATADECEHTLSTQLRDAELVIDEVQHNLTAAEKVAQRLAEMVAIAKTAHIVERPVAMPVEPPANRPVPMPEVVAAPEAAENAENPAREDPVSALQALRSRAA